MMRKFLLLTFLLQSFCISAQQASTTKPWTYWWWMGSAVSKKDITHQLEYFHRAGLGGVHIIPIYGVKGSEEKFIPFLSPEWLGMMQHTVWEGKRLGIGVDLSTGTGWPFGGPNVPIALAARNMTLQDQKLVIKPTGQMVKRPAPGGEGFVVDPFHANGMSTYLQRFDSAFSNTAERPRSMYMDSYEAYGANWTDDFSVEFKKRRGYDLESKLKLFADSTGTSEAQLVQIDYHQTLSELLLERYARTWTKWSKNHGFLTRYQAHGSPGNLLDLYGEADIPETESFGTSRFSIPGLRIDPDYSINQFGTPNPLAMKFASSAAHFYGKKLVSSETGTWLANHFKVSLSQIKPQIDELFTAGINHIFYHGTTYSPADVAYPGWLFYASTHFGPTSHFAEQFSFLNSYVERCQELLQDSRPDNDVLVYFPIHDLWATRAKSAGGVHLLEVHHVDRWLLDLPFGKLSENLWKEGYSFDYVSDQQLNQLRFDVKSGIQTGKTSYKAILIPASVYMPAETFQQLVRLAQEGAPIIFEDQFPEHVTGYKDNASRQREFLKEKALLQKNMHVFVEKDWRKALVKNGIKNEELAKKGLTFIRKKKENGDPMYFIANVGNTFTSGWVKLGRKGNFSKYDPLTGKSEPVYQNTKNEDEQFLSLLPGQSCFLIKSSENARPAKPARLPRELSIEGPWNLTFVKGMPSLPAPAKLQSLHSWAQLPDSAVYFSGTARYEVRFDVPAEFSRTGKIELYLGDVREVAAVKLNGEPLGTAWSIPFKIHVLPDLLKEKSNLLEIEVTNLSANYMRLRDRQLPEWKIFYDINIVDITYKKFDASRWEPMPSGLLGPVRLIFE